MTAASNARITPAADTRGLPCTGRGLTYCGQPTAFLCEYVRPSTAAGAGGTVSITLARCETCAHQWSQLHGVPMPQRAAR